MTTQEQIAEYLKNLPSQWAGQLTTLLTQIQADKGSVDCAKVKECETLTSLSEFTIDGSEVSIQYKDENGVTVTRTFDAAEIVNQSLDNVDPSCLTDETTWSNMTYTERMQLFVTAHCDCCSTTTTTTIP